MTGQDSARASITSITNANPCVVTVDTADLFSTNQFVRLTDLNGRIPTPRGMDPINDLKFRITVIDSTSFSLQDAITFKNIDSTDFTPYVEGGNCNLVQPDFMYNGDL